MGVTVVVETVGEGKTVYVGGALGRGGHGGQLVVTAGEAAALEAAARRVARMTVTCMLAMKPSSRKQLRRDS